MGSCHQTSLAKDAYLTKEFCVQDGLACLQRILEMNSSKQRPVLPAFQQVVQATDSNSQSFRNGTEEEEHNLEEAAVTQQQVANLHTVCLGKEQQESIHRRSAEGRTQQEATLAHYGILFVWQCLSHRGREICLFVSLIVVEDSKLVPTCPISVMVEGTCQQENEVRQAESHP